MSGMSVFSGLLGQFVGFFNETGIAILGGLGVFATVIALGRAFVPHDPMVARLQSHKKRREALLAEIIADKQPEKEKKAKQASINFLRPYLERLKLTRGDEARRTVDQLAQAGWRSRDMLVIFQAARMIAPFLGGAGGIFVLSLMGGERTLMTHVLVAAGGVIAGGYAPVVYLRNVIQNRYKKLRTQLPDGLDLLVICAEAGLSLDAGLTRVARELGPSTPELADELGLAAIELGFLPNRRQALLNLIKRADLPPIRAVVNTLMQTERYGTPLAHSLRVLAAEFRDERLMRAEEKAARLPAIMTVPMILFILPTLFIVLIGPAIIQALTNFHW